MLWWLLVHVNPTQVCFFRL
uniref:Uncharacterized protein n=1 Tax=Arundo donax TaxID=35708 RepID=A0A0A8ZZY5_ARUDO